MLARSRRGRNLDERLIIVFRSSFVDVFVVVVCLLAIGLQKDKIGNYELLLWYHSFWID